MKSMASTEMAERLRQNRLAIAPRIVRECSRIKQAVVDRLIENRIGLREAAAKFNTAHRVAVNWLAICLGSKPVEAAPADDQESICRMVIGWAYLRLSHRPIEAERVAGLLERELQDCLEENKTEARR